MTIESPLQKTNAKPLNIVMVANVTMRLDIFILVTRIPLNIPTNTPIERVITMTSYMCIPVLNNWAATTPIIPITAPTDMSICPIKRTIVIPTAEIPMIEL